MVGLKTSTRLRAIMARRRRRISSSLLPENMGPQMTSIQPTFPIMISMWNRSGWHKAGRESSGGALHLLEGSGEKVVGGFDPDELLGFGEAGVGGFEFGAGRILISSALDEELLPGTGFEIFEATHLS